MRRRSPPKRHGSRQQSNHVLEHVIGGFDEDGFAAPDTSFTEAPNFDAVPFASDASFDTIDGSSASLESSAADAPSLLAPSDGGSGGGIVDSGGGMSTFEQSTIDSSFGNETTNRATPEIPTLDPDPTVPTIDPAPLPPTFNPAPSPDGAYSGPFRDGDFIHDPRSLTPEQAQGLQDLIDSPQMQPWMADDMRHFLQDYRNGVDRIFPDHPNPFPRPYPRTSDPDGNIG